MTLAACRLCHSSADRLVPLLSLGELYISNFLNAAEDSSRYPKAPLELVACDPEQGGCGLVQLKHSVAAVLMYQQYWYRSGTNVSMRRALAQVTQQAECLVQPRAADIVLDIGCNDGTLLRSYRTPGLIRAGFEPAENLLQEARVQTQEILQGYFDAGAFARAFPGRRARVITSIAMFYDLDDPRRFTADVAQCLAEDGVWIIQMSCLPLMLERNAFDNICHEHLAYYSLGCLQRLLRSHRLEAIDAELNDINGGSFRVLVAHEGGTVPRSDFGRARIQGLEKFEQALCLGNQAVYRAFAQRVLQIRKRLVAFIRKEAARGAVFCVYGASTKGNTLLQFFGLDSRIIRAAADRSPQKWGKKTIGTEIPIVSEEQARAAPPDYFLVLPWHFLDEFVEREESYLKQGGRFLVPLPSPEIVGPQGRTLL